MIKQLKLRKETVRTLGGNQMMEIHGGWSTHNSGQTAGTSHNSGSNHLKVPIRQASGYACGSDTFDLQTDRY